VVRLCYCHPPCSHHTVSPGVCCGVFCVCRDLQIIQSLIGALKSPASASGLDAGGTTGPCGPPSAASPVPGNRAMRAAGSRSLPKNRCNSPIATVPLHSL
jgi:hypothetical protein